MKANAGRDRAGFTLIELLVMVAILGVLAGLAGSAIQGARDLAARLQCQNNLKQIAVAAFSHAGLHRRLPDACTMPYAQPGATPSIADASGIPPIEVVNDSAARKDSDPNHPFGPNWAVYLLPQLGEEALYKEARVADYLAGYKAGDDARRDRWRSVVQGRRPAVFLCPPDSGHGTPFQGYDKAPGPWARGNYAANAGPGWWQTSLNGASYTEAYGATGPVMGINFGAVLQQIPDGTSNTVMFNEVRVGVSAGDPRGVWALGYPGSSVTAANAIGDCVTPNDAMELSDDVEGCPSFWYPGIGSRDRIGCSTGYFNLGWPSWQAQARSRHRGGVNVCFADGSVHFVSDLVSQPAWFAMLSAQDGVAYTLP
jgi:prepilin-type N-terminal cleavage/methylation domain-containing protein/prepilin-type processing-associated H-X9-DG protein